MRAITTTVAPTARSSATVSRPHCSFYLLLPFFLLARIYIHGRGIRKQTGAILLSGSRQRNGPEWRDDGTDGRTRHSWQRETPGAGGAAARGNRTGGTRWNRTDRTRVRIGARAIPEAATRAPIIDALMTSGRFRIAVRILTWIGGQDD